MFQQHQHRLHKTKPSFFPDVFTVPDLYEGKDQARVVMTIQVLTLFNTCTQNNKYDDDSQLTFNISSTRLLYRSLLSHTHACTCLHLPSPMQVVRPGCTDN